MFKVTAIQNKADKQRTDLIFSVELPTLDLLLESNKRIVIICQDFFEKSGVFVQKFLYLKFAIQYLEEMFLEKSVEEKIKQAIEAGEFDNLKGAGKPLNLDEYFDAPAEVRAGYSILKSSNFVPEEVELLREVGLLREKIKICGDEEKHRLRKNLEEKSLALRIMFERNKRRR